jgi:DNA-binding MarR family transcriptional regulator
VSNPYDDGKTMSDDLSLQQFLPYRCNHLAERISVSLSRIYVERFGVSIPQWRILATLAESGELQAKQIGKLTSMDKVRVSRAVASLVAAGLLLRRACSNDNRASLLTLSAAGKRLYRRIVPEALAWEQALVAPLSASEEKTLFRLLDKLDARLLEMNGQGPD